MKSREGRWAAAEGNETEAPEAPEAPEAAGDGQSGFACPGCAAAGIKELAALPACAAELGCVGQRGGGRLPGLGFTTPAKQRRPEERGQLCWRPSALMGKHVWSPQLGYRKESVRMVRSNQDEASEGKRESERASERGPSSVGLTAEMEGDKVCERTVVVVRDLWSSCCDISSFQINIHTYARTHTHFLVGTFPDCNALRSSLSRPDQAASSAGPFTFHTQKTHTFVERMST